MSTERPALPHDPETERAVLACYLLSPALLDTFPTTPEHFHVGANRAIHAAFCYLRDEGIRVDLRTLQARLVDQDDLGMVGGVAYLAALDLDLPDLGGIARYVDVLEDRRMRRRLVAAAKTLDASARNGVGAAETLERGLESLARIADASDRGKGLSIGDVLDELVPRVTTMEPGSTIGIETGIPSLDAMTAGMLPGHLWIVAGRPAMGKSAFAHNIARDQVRRGIPSAIFSLEMTAQEDVLRILAIELQIPSKSIAHGHTSRFQREELAAARARLRTLPLHIFDAGSVTSGHLCSVARGLHARGRLRVLWVDHMSFVTGPRSENRNLELEQVYHALKALAKELGITVAALSQLNRDVERRADKRPILADLRDCGAAEQDADLVLFPFRPAVYAPSATPDLMQLIVAKHRDGPTGVVPVRFIAETTTIRAYAHGEPFPPDAFPR